MSWDNPRRYGPARLKRERIHLQQMQDTITTIDKDSPEFAAISSQCTPVKEIQVKHGMATPLHYSKDRGTVYIYRKGQEKLTLW